MILDLITLFAYSAIGFMVLSIALSMLASIVLTIIEWLFGDMPSWDQ